MPSYNQYPGLGKAERLCEAWSDRINLVEEFDSNLSYEKKIVILSATYLSN